MSLALKNLDRSIKRAVQLKQQVHQADHLDNLGATLVIEHRDRVPEGEGTLKGSIRHNVINNGARLQVGVGKEAWYWIFLERGTIRHPIFVKPGRKTRSRKGAKALAGEGFGPVKSVEHPGIWPPRPFVRPVIEDHYTITDELKKSLRQIDPTKPRRPWRRRRRKK